MSTLYLVGIGPGNRGEITEDAIKSLEDSDIIMGYPKYIDSIEVYTYEAAVSILADKEKWHPTNKETADHSLPFIIASTLVNKDFWYIRHGRHSF